MWQKLIFSELGFLSSVLHPKQKQEHLSGCLTLCQTNFLCSSMILMTYIVLKFSYTLNDFPLLKRIHLYEGRAFLENVEHNVIVIVHFMVFKVDFQG